MSQTQLTTYLKDLLADSYIVMLKTQNYHWNVTGLHFHSLHEMFQEQYEDLFEAVDELAERIRAIGSQAPGTFQQFQQLSKIDSEDIKTKDVEMLKSLIGDHKKLVETGRKVIAEAQKENDDATMDMAIKRVQTHDKHIWMLESSLE
ncbi:MAG: Dps family protein [Patescibacteria group bacterium]